MRSEYGGGASSTAGSGHQDRTIDWNVRGAVGLVLVLLGGYACRDAWADILHVALRDPEASQVMLAPIVAGWLFWIRRGRLSRYAPSATWVGPLLIVAGWALYRIGDAQLIQVFWHAGAVVAVVGCVASIAGGGALLRVLPAVGALAFLIPVPGRIRLAIAGPLQSATARVTEALLDTFGVGIERSGAMLRINNQEVLIAEACNGMRMVFALVIVSYAFAYGVPLRNGVRALIVALSPLTAIVFNVFRLIPVIWAFGNLAPETAEAVHVASGWAMLPFAFLSLLGLLRLLRWAQVPVAPYALAYGT